MIAVDTNVLVYAHRREVGEHERAKGVMGKLAEGARPWAIAWPCVFEFYSVVTNPRIWKAPTTPAQAWTQVQGWSGSPSLRLIGEPNGFESVLERFVTRPKIRGPIVHDARIAVICMAHGVEVLLSRDRDFSLFPKLVVRNPFTLG